MNYVGDIFRPPSEADSLLLQVTLGCSHNRCAFCSMYAGKRFAVKPWPQIEADLRTAAAAGPIFRRAFLCDGDALILSTERLLQILHGINHHLPWIERVGIYGDARSVGPKSVEELVALRQAGLGIVYHGVESGDDATLQQIHKGATAAACVEAGAKLKEAGITHSVIVLLGIGGTERSAQHAHLTAALLSQLDPPFAAALTVTIMPNTPLAALEQSGQFTLPSKWGLLQELRALLQEVQCTNCRFSANHASNYLPLRGTLPRDQARLLNLVDAVLLQRDEGLLKPEGLRGL